MNYLRMNKVLAAILLFLLQIVIFNHLDFSRFLYPQIFILILISLPPYLNRSWQVLIAFLVGIIADFFVSTPGLHASACLLLIMFRMFMFRRYDLDEIIANKASINIHSMAMDKYIYISLSMVLVYHVYAFALESVGAIDFLNYTITTLLSSVVSFLIILLIQFLFYRRLGVQ